MGQAVDLPDPMQSPAAAAAASADDLLSQLASEEIDRLLAESDEEVGAPFGEASAAPVAESPAPPIAESPAPPAAEQEPASLDTILTEAASSPAPSVSSAPPAISETSSIATPSLSSPASAAESAQAASADAGISAAIAALDAGEVDAKTLDASLAAQPAVASDAVHAAVNEIETTLEERSGLTDSAAGDISLNADDDTPIPAYLKPLVWLNAPMMLLPESIRDAMGKVAILTLFNAVAIFAYVLLFRGHHH